MTTLEQSGRSDEARDLVLRSGSVSSCNDLLGGICRYCDKPVLTESEAAITHSYWQGLPFICHKACKDAGGKQEAFDCQVIDADCNDCRHYKRGKLASRVVSLLRRTDGTTVEVSHQPNIFIGGRCLKFDKPTVAQPNKWSGLECFEHRRNFGVASPAPASPLETEGSAGNEIPAQADAMPPNLKL